MLVLKKVWKILKFFKKKLFKEKTKLDNECASFVTNKKSQFGKKPTKLKKMIKDFKKEGYTPLEIAGICVSALVGLPYLYCILA